MRTLIVLVLSLLFGNLSLFAQSAQRPTGPQYNLGYGLAFRNNLRQMNTHEDSDRSINLRNIPLIQLQAGPFSLGPQGLSLQFFRKSFISLSANLSRGGDRYESTLMAPRYEGFFLGMSARVMAFTLSVNHDISSYSKGVTSEFSYNKFLMINEELSLRLGTGLEWFDRNYAEYYYGVRRSEVTALRPYYQPGSFFKPKISAGPIYKFTEKMSVITFLNLKYFPSKITRSPLMNGKSLEWGGIVGLNYNL